MAKTNGKLVQIELLKQLCQICKCKKQATINKQSSHRISEKHAKMLTELFSVYRNNSTDDVSNKSPKDFLH